MVPHITDAITNWIESVSVIPVDGKEGPADVCVIELGGTVGMSSFKVRVQYLMYQVLIHSLPITVYFPFLSFTRCDIFFT